MDGMFLWLLEKAGNGRRCAQETEEMLIVCRRREHLRGDRRRDEGGDGRTLRDRLVG